MVVSFARCLVVSTGAVAFFWVRWPVKRADGCDYRLPGAGSYEQVARKTSAPLKIARETPPAGVRRETARGLR